MSEFQDASIEGNPYRSPPIVSDAVVVPDEAEQVITHKVLSTLRQTQPWVRFLSVLGFIFSVMMVLIGLVGFVAMTFGPSQARTAQRFVLLVYIPMGVIYFFPSLLLFRYASRINALWMTRSVRRLEDALEAQRSFWKFVGILMLLVIALYGVAIVAAGVIGAMRAIG